MNEKLGEKFLSRRCRITDDEFVLTSAESRLCERFAMPLPTLSPRERMRKLLAFNNYTYLHNGICAATGAKILQIYPTSVPFPVYSSEYWWSDDWDPLSYGVDYNFAEPFFPQFGRLRDRVPQQALTVLYTSIENCDYINGASFCKNCYLIFNAASSEDCLYGFKIWHSRDCIDCSSIHGCELCYDCVACKECYEVRHSFNCKGCRESAFLWNCVSCADCFCCVNLRHAKFCWFNEQLTEAEFRARLAAVELDNYDQVELLRAEFMKFVRLEPQPAIRGFELEDATGDFLYNCKRAHNCFDCTELEDCVNCIRVDRCNDCMDYYVWGVNCELIYNSVRVGYNSNNIKCSFICYSGASDLEYCMVCISSRNCFGCVGLRNKEYCIFNKQYQREDYFELRERIVAQFGDRRINNGDNAYGEFFPYYLSLFPYNRSDANLFMPLTKDEAVKRGADWEESVSPPLPASVAWSALPPRSSALSNSILNETFACITSGKPFRVVAKELRIYQTRNIPLPREHWEVRSTKRLMLMNEFRLYETVSYQSGQGLQTSFPPDQGWKILTLSEYISAYAK